MKSTYYYIVKVDANYNNEINLKSGVSLLVNNTIESVAHINRIVEVVAVPEDSEVLPGDKIMIHHNILRIRTSKKGIRMASDYLIRDDLYIVPPEEVYMYKREEEDWRPIGPYCYVKPMALEEKKTKGGLTYTEEADHKGGQKLTGIMWYPNLDLVRARINRGDTVFYDEWSEHEFLINGQRFYRMKAENVLGIYNGEDIKHGTVPI